MTEDIFKNYKNIRVCHLSKVYGRPMVWSILECLIQNERLVVATSTKKRRNKFGKLFFGSWRQHIPLLGAAQTHLLSNL